MTISIAQPTAAHLELLSRDLAVHTRRGLETTIASEVDGDLFKVAGPYPIYNGTITGVLNETLLKSAADNGETGWAFLVIRGESTWVAELAMREGKLTLATFYPQSYAQAFVNALARAEAYDRANPDEDYDMRVLRAPSLSLNAIWLHGHVSRLAPIQRVPTPLRGEHVYSETLLVKLLRPTAERRLATHDKVH